MATVSPSGSSMRRIVCAILVVVPCFLCECRRPEPSERVEARETSPKRARYRSPFDLAVFPGGKLALTADYGSGTVSLVDLEAGRTVQHLEVGGKPFGVAVAPNGRWGAVADVWNHRVLVFAVKDGRLEGPRLLWQGAAPRHVLFAPDGASLFVTLGGEDAVVRVDLAGKLLSRWQAPREPRRLALSPDGRLLAAASSKSGQLRCWDLASGKPVWERMIDDGFNLRGLAFGPGGDVYSTGLVHRYRHVSKENIGQGWVMDNRVTRLAAKAEAQPAQWQISLDRSGEAVGDPEGLAWSPDGKTLALTAAGTQELLLLDAKEIPWMDGFPGDFLPLSLELGGMRRVPLGGRPMALAYLSDDRIVVANHLFDAVQVVDARGGKVIRSISLEGPKEVDVGRKGEALFYDARRSHHQWFSCHTCHVDGHTNGRSFDTLNDGDYADPKATPSLRNVVHTGPWTWQGTKTDLQAAVAHSFQRTMFGPAPTREETAAVVAFLDTLTTPPAPGAEPDASWKRGRELFRGKAGCVRCHQGKWSTSTGTFDVGLKDFHGRSKRHNPPSLLGLWDRGPFLHDERARSLEVLLQRHHRPDMVGGEPLTGAETVDLLRYLRSL